MGVIDISSIMEHFLAKVQVFIPECQEKGNEKEYFIDHTIELSMIKTEDKC